MSDDELRRHFDLAMLQGRLQVNVEDLEKELAQRRRDPTRLAEMTALVVARLARALVLGR